MQKFAFELPYAAAPCDFLAKIARKDVENATQATLAHFGSVFRLFWA
jgi:hypothetical protein